MKIGRPRKEEPEIAPGAEDSGAERKAPELSRKDILAVIIAMFQLFLPLIVGLVIVGAVVALILR
ncbi:MAG: hypothetical protein NTY63_07330 [Candidatus Bipolaricaulota bacterium]|nr:hypothetical protein [Candidatus Bipolaricaulota bacterium]